MNWRVRSGRTDPPFGSSAVLTLDGGLIVGWTLDGERQGVWGGQQGKYVAAGLLCKALRTYPYWLYRQVALAARMSCGRLVSKQPFCGTAEEAESAAVCQTEAK
jgi:hypothetical protein